MTMTKKKQKLDLVYPSIYLVNTCNLQSRISRKFKRIYFHTTCILFPPYFSVLCSQYASYILLHKVVHYTKSLTSWLLLPKMVPLSLPIDVPLRAANRAGRHLSARDSLPHCTRQLLLGTCSCHCAAAPAAAGMNSGSQLSSEVGLAVEEDLMRSLN